MTEFAREIVPINIEEELKQSYLEYAMSVIVGRALPDVRDGLKPVHRRVLYAMHVLNNDWNKAYKKSARVVGDVIGKYHPHGDTAVYDTIVRLAQTFSMRYTLIDGQGNFGSVDGDAAAAMRYTEVRMDKFAHALLEDLEKDTVNFTPNYDETEFEPAVLPTRIPNLLVNGSSGIAVGMATNIAPHRLNEVIDACVALIDNQFELSIEQLMEYIPGPDFPTAGIINGRAGIVQAYKTGRGRVYIRARTEIEEDEKSHKATIIVTELPYQVNKARLIEKIADLVRDKKLEGISGLRDESDKDGMRIVIELKRGEVPDVVLNNLYTYTQMQNVFGINMVALDRGQPKLFNLLDMLNAFLRHRQEVVTRRTRFELAKARSRAHVLEGLGVALASIERVIALVRNAPNPAQAKEVLLAETWQPGEVISLLEEIGRDAARPEDLAHDFGMVAGGYRLSPDQAQAILDLRLHRLTGLEQDKIFGEFKELLEKIKEYLAILASRERLLEVIREDLLLVKEQFGDERRTEIRASQEDLSMEDLIADENMVVTLTHAGYVKTQTLDTYQAQRRGGRGKSATSMKDEDFIEQLVIASQHDTLLCFSNYGKLYWLKVYTVPQASRISKGRPIVNLLPLDKDEKIQAMLPVREYKEGMYIFMATANGIVKKTALTEFSRPRVSGIISVDLVEGDRLVGVSLTHGECDMMLFTNSGKVIRFPETDVRAMGRNARGVKGINLTDDQRVISSVIAPIEGDILTVTENGFGKRTKIDEYRVQGRGGQGIISIQVSERNGTVVGAAAITHVDEVMLLTNGGTLVRTRAEEISQVGRNTQGVKLINLANAEKLVSVQPVVEIDLENEENVNPGAEALIDHREEDDLDHDHNSKDESN
ncbi:DNA gyrase subunit A [Piscirickettsia salmonis]|uniref:DNA gyrase subunit A n=1 Tax=Piscirickettsia salmonis TaxID=1238 RepID=UPI0012B7EEF5|nr:DNA gyrase subunit A [Piscirickettsia salmonis]QGP51001.1 DNA gyrase subunit A [Piscirickettsia salmonis]